MQGFQPPESRKISVLTYPRYAEWFMCLITRVRKIPVMLEHKQNSRPVFIEQHIFWLPESGKYIRPEHRPDNNLLNGGLGKLQARNIIPRDRSALEKVREWFAKYTPQKKVQKQVPVPCTCWIKKRSMAQVIRFLKNTQKKFLIEKKSKNGR